MIKTSIFKMKKLIKAAVLFNLLINASYTSANIINISTSNGLSNRRVYSATADKLGYMWFATKSSIDRYDGNSFNHYDFTSFNDYTKIRGVVSNKLGDIFAYTDKCIYKYDFTSDFFNQLKISIPENAAINTIFIDSKNNVWVGTTTGLLVYNKNFSQIHLNLVIDVAVYCFAEDKRNCIWIGSHQNLIQLNTDVKNNILSKKTFLSGTRIQTIDYDSINGTLWIGAFSNGLYQLPINSKNNKLNAINIFQTTTPIRSICNLKNGKTWVGTDGNGILEFSTNSGVFLQNISKDTKNDIYANSIYDIHLTNTLVWVSTYSFGVLLYNFSNLNYQHILTNNNNGNFSTSNYINCILEDSNNNIWYGTVNGIKKYNVKSKSWSYYLQQTNRDMKSVVILAMAENDNYIWAGGYATDLYCINKKNGEIKVFKTENMPDKLFIYSLIIDNNELWYGGTIGKLTRHNLNNNKIVEYKITGVNKLFNYNKDTMLVGTINGLFIINKHNHKASHITFKSKNKSRKNISFINSIYNDPQIPNEIWLSSDGGGLYRLNLNKNSYITFSSSNGLSTNYAYGILKDNLNRLWVSSENGMNCLNLNNNSFESNLPLKQFTTNSYNIFAATKLKNGNLAWGTPNGAIIIDPNNKNNKTDTINLRFRNFYIHNNLVIAGGINSPLTKTIDFTDKITLSYDQRYFSIDFNDINDYNFPKTKFRWKLDGFDRNWAEYNEKNRAEYTNVPPGRYTFILSAEGNNLIDKERRIDIIIRPPFWASIYAFFLYLALAIIIIMFIKNYTKRKMEAKNADEKIRFFTNLAHDIRTPITLVKAPLNSIESEDLSESGRISLSLAVRNLDKLFNLVSQLLDFQKIENKTQSLTVESTELNTFLNEIIDDFFLPAKNKNIEIRTSIPKENTIIWIDKKKVTTIIENLLSNAIKYTPENGIIQIQSRITNRKLDISIIDNGIGIPQKNQHQIFNSFYRAQNAINSNETGSGIGLMLTKKLIETHKGKIEFSSLEHKGSTFTICIPCEISSYGENEIVYEYKNHERESIVKSSDRDLIKTLMLVEDNHEIREFLSNQLGMEYNIIEAVDGENALKLLEESSPDFVLTDIMMPGISGIELCRKIKTDINYSHIPVILLSALSEKTKIIEGFEAGAEDYITKPFDLSVLRSKIKAIIQSRIEFKRKSIENTLTEKDVSNFNPLDKDFLEKAISITENNLTNPDFYVDNLASELAMSRTVLFKKIKSLTNENPKDFIKEIRMKKAANLLLENKYQIIDVADMTGFVNAKHFSTFFKKYFGVTPSVFMKNNKK